MPEKKPQAVELVSSMGWEALPYDCVGMARPRALSDTRTVWSWIVLIPWAANDSKPWIDGAEMNENPLLSPTQQKEKVFTIMRDALDARYGEVVGSRDVDKLLKELEED